MVDAADELRLVAATPADEHFYWEVNNEQSVRSQSLKTALIPFDAHQVWFRRRLAERNSRLFVAWLGDGRCGVSRLDPCEDANVVVISIALDRAFRGRGLSLRLIERTAAHASDLGATCVRAIVRPTNEVSVRAFLRAGFVEERRTVVHEVDVIEMVLLSSKT